MTNEEMLKHPYISKDIKNQRKMNLEGLNMRRLIKMFNAKDPE